MKKMIVTIVLLMVFVSTSAYAGSNCNLYLMGGINSNSAQSLIQQLRAVDEASDCSEATLTILSGGGSIMSTIAIVGVLTNMKKRVNTLCAGYCASAASLLLAAGSGTRSMFSTATVMIHQAAYSFSGEYYTDIEDEYEAISDINEKWAELYDNYTNLSKTEYIEIIEKDYEFNMTPKQALKYGFVDKIIPGID